MQKAQETASKLVKAREDMTKMLDLVEKTLDQRPFTVAPGIVLTGFLAVLARWDDWDRAMVDDKGDEVITIKGAISENILSDLLTQQCLALRTLMTFATGQNETQGITQAIDFSMNFGAKTAPTR